MVVLLRKEGEELLEVLQTLQENARVGVEESEGEPLQDEVKVGFHCLSLIHNLKGKAVLNDVAQSREGNGAKITLT